MIWVSTRLHDELFKVRTFRNERLTPTPVGDHWKTEGAFFENASFKRIVEKYPWGAVLYLTSRKHGQHFTIVARGEVDVWSGKVVEGDATMQLQDFVPWYDTMVREECPPASAAPQLALNNKPDCIGYHAGAEASDEDRVICDGGVNAEGAVEPACSWREDCINFQAWCGKEGREPQSFLEGKSKEDQAKIVLAIARPKPQPVKPPKASKVEVKVPEDDGAPKLPDVRPLRKTATGPAPISGEELMNRTRALTNAATRIFNGIARQTERALVRERGLAQVGDFFITDRRVRSKYLALYAQNRKGRATPIMSTRLRPQQMVLAIQLPVDIVRPELDPIRDNARPIDIGKFKVEVKVDANAPPASIVAVVYDLIQSGAIELPSTLIPKLNKEARSDA